MRAGVSALTETILRFWARIRANETAHSTLLRSTALIAFLTIGVKVVSLLKDLVVAQRFGVSAELDAFLIAFVLPSFAINVIAGSFQASFVPTYIEVREKQGDTVAQELFSAVLWRALLLLAAVAVLMGLFSRPLLSLVASGFDEATLALCERLYWLLLPSILINGLVVIWGATLNSFSKFALAAIAPSVVPAVTIALLLVAPAEWGVHVLAYGLLVGFGMQVLLLGWALHKRGIRIGIHRGVPSPALNQVFQQYLPMIAGSLLMSGTTLVDQAMATPLGQGSVSALNYGIKLSSLILQTGALAVGTAVLPYFSRMIAHEDWRGVRSTLRAYLGLTLLTSAFMSLFLILFSTPLVRLLFERGAFTAEDTALVSQIQAFYALQIPFYIGGIIMVRLISAMKANYLLTLATIMNFALNVVLNYLFIGLLGVAGIALSTSFVYLASFTFVSVAVTWRLRRIAASQGEV